MKDSYYHIEGHVGAYVFASPGVAFGDDTWMVNRVSVHRTLRGRGLAKQLMREVLADADAEGVTLVLTVEPDFDDGLTYEQLEVWYSSLGFKWTDDGWMERVPVHSDAVDSTRR